MSSEVHALIQLIDDPDENIFAQVKDQLSSFGSEILPILKDTQIVEDYGDLFYRRIENLIHELHFEDIKKSLHHWIHSDEKDLLDGALIIARYKYYNLNEAVVEDRINEIKRNVWKNISLVSTAFEKVKALNHVLFEEYQFCGNKRNYYSPLNLYINTVLELKEGNPLSLSIIYSIIASRLEIPIYGVNLPNHFILAYMDELNINMLTGNENKFGVLFYINPFNNGELISTKGIEDYLLTLNLPKQNSYFEPCSNSTILKRMLSNLINDYTLLKRKEKVNELKTLKKLFHED